MLRSPEEEHDDFKINAERSELKETDSVIGDDGIFYSMIQQIPPMSRS